MPLDAARAASRTEALAHEFAQLGTVTPRGTPRKDLALHEYWVASSLRAWAEPRYRRALAALVELRVIRDPERFPEPVGTSRDVATGGFVSVRLTVAEPQERLDLPGFLADLEAAGVKRALIKRLRAKHTSVARAAHVFKPSLLTS